MKSTKKKNNKDWRLGTILTELSMLSPEQLESALIMTRSTGLPLGCVLLATGVLSKEDLRAMLQAQSMLKDNLVDGEQLLAAMPAFKKDHSLGFEGALRSMKWHRDSDIPTNKLGDLLIQSKLISQLQLAEGLAHNRNSLQPLGRTLVLLGALSPRALKHALVIQERIRRGEITREQGLASLREVAKKNDLLTAKTNERKDSAKTTEVTRLGDLLIEAGIVQEEEFSRAIELSAYKSKLIGEILIEAKLISSTRLAAALELQQLISLGLVERSQAIATLGEIDGSTNVAEALEKSIAEDSKRRLLSSQALISLASQLTGVNFDDLVARVGREAQTGFASSKGLRVSKEKPDAEGTRGAPSKTEKLTSSVVEQLYLDVLNGALEVEQAMILLNICLKDECPVSRALGRLGWTINARPFRESEMKFSDSDLINWLTQDE